MYSIRIVGLISVLAGAVSSQAQQLTTVTTTPAEVKPTVTDLPVSGNRVTDVQEVHIHLRRNSHPIQLLLPLACRDSVIDENNELNVQRLSPADHDLAVNQPIIDPM